MSNTDQLTPLITIGGFLGSGKTTLVNGLLRQAGGKRIVVFVNDFGAINIDYDLIETSDTDRVSLKNGCVCCSLNDDLITSIVDFCGDNPPDAFVVEASGVSDPRALDQSIYALHSAGYIELSNQLYVVDADQFGSLDYADTELIIDHAASSQTILINKCDLIDAGRLEKLKNTFHRSCPNSLIAETVHCVISDELLLGVGQHKAISKSSTPKNEAHLLSNYTSCSYTNLAPIDQAQFLASLPQLTSVAIRAKGTIYFDNDPTTPVLFDLVGSRHTFRPLANTRKKPTSNFVAIGWKDRLSKPLVDELLEIGKTSDVA